AVVHAREVVAVQSGPRGAYAAVLRTSRLQNDRHRALRADRADVRADRRRRRPDGVPTLRFLQCRWGDGMGREHDVGRVSVGAVDSEYQLAYPHRGAGRDRAVADSGRRGAAARTPAPAQLAMNTALAVIGRLPLPVGLWLGRRFGDAAYL